MHVDATQTTAHGVMLEEIERAHPLQSTDTLNMCVVCPLITCRYVLCTSENSTLMVALGKGQGVNKFMKIDIDSIFHGNLTNNHCLNKNHMQHTVQTLKNSVISQVVCISTRTEHNEAYFSILSQIPSSPALMVDGHD